MKAGWQEIALGELCSIARGGSPRPIQRFLTNDSNGINWIKIGDATRSGKYIFETEEKIKPEGIARSRLVKEGDFLLSNSMSFGRPYILKTSGCIHDGWLVLSPDKKRVDQDFLYHLLGSPLIFDQFDRLAAGSTVRNLNIGLVQGVRVPLPPLEEQKRIVAVLDEAFEGLARARENTESNLNDAHELMKNSIDELMASTPNSQTAKLGQLCSFENGDRGKNYPGRKAFVPAGVAFINAGHLLNGPINWQDMNFIPPSHFKKLSNGKVRKGDLLFCLRGSLGKFGIVDTDEPGAIASSLIIVRPDEKLIPEYLAAYFESRHCADMIDQFANGAAQPNLSAKSLAAFDIALPSIKLQQQVVAKIDELRNEIGHLAEAYNRQSNELDNLRLSLLQKAFSGDLT